MPHSVFHFDPDCPSCEGEAPSVDLGCTPPALSATDEATEPHRIPRLHQTWGQACAAVRLLSRRYQDHWHGAIVSLNDNKGTLEVSWRDAESRVMFEGVIVGAWERECEHTGARGVAAEELASA